MTQPQDKKDNNSKVGNSTFVEPKVFLSKDKNYITMFLPGNMAVRKHVNFFKSILGVPFEKKA